MLWHGPYLVLGSRGLIAAPGQGKLLVLHGVAVNKTKQIIAYCQLRVSTMLGGFY
jgi:hypothetical protein